ncbi:DUF1931 domain-containing protein [Candidatus Bathyarchaeota archaeon]|nr:DUF1931 domain-containing protein [Candidatus Bathyarchaeota archaeon]
MAPKDSQEKILIVKSAVKELIKSQECKTSSDLLKPDALNAEVKEIVIKACKRAKANKRTTVYPRDL